MRKEGILLNNLKGILDHKDCFETVAPEHARWICERLAWHKLLPLAAALQDPFKKKCSLITRTFREVTLNNLAREEYYFAQSTQIFNALDQAGLTYMPFKGPFWGTQLYEAYHWRHIGDIDILLSKPAARTAVDILLPLGYQPDILEGSLEKEFALRGELVLLPDGKNMRDVPVELHWDLMPSPRFLHKKFLKNSDFTQKTLPGRWRGMVFNLPIPEIQLIYYLLHATCQHQFSRFVHIANIVHFLHKFPNLDWQLIYEFSVERCAQSPVYHALKYALAFHPLTADARNMMGKLKPSLPARLLARVLQPETILFFTPQQGKTRRNLFRAAMSL